MESLDQLESRVLESINLCLKAHESDNKLMDSHRYLIALSGGSDSMFLMYALSRLISVSRLSALYVDHQLSNNSKQWLMLCTNTCKKLGIKYFTTPIDLDKEGIKNLESRARVLRYQAITDQMSSKVTALTAHHLDDQFETIMMRLMKGTSYDGLKGIHLCRKLGKGYLLRPMLNISKADILRLVKSWNIPHVTDESNDSIHFDRNYIRNKITPNIIERFPKANEKLVSTIVLLQDQLDDLSIFIKEKVDPLLSKGFINNDDLNCVPVSMQATLIKKLIFHLCDTYPAPQNITNIMNYLKTKEKKTSKLFSLNNYSFWLYSEGIYYIKCDEYLIDDYFGKINFSLVPSVENVLPKLWVDSNKIEIRVGRYGDKIKPWRGEYLKSVKDILYEKGVLPWVRPHVPLIYYKNHLVSVSNLCISADVKENIHDSENYVINWDTPKSYN